MPTTQHAVDPYATLARRDRVLKRLVSTIGGPNPFDFDAGGRTGNDLFAALVLHIVGQQISTRVALSLYDRLQEYASGRISPATMVALKSHELRKLGLSASKARYLHELAERVEDGSLRLDDLRTMSDGEALDALIAVPGIGRWTAEMFLIFQLHRPDVVVAADIGIRTAIQRHWALEDRPTPEAVRQRAAPWSPFRSYACAVLWTSLRR